MTVRDYVKEMMDAWTTDGEQAARDLGVTLLSEIRLDQQHLNRQELAIRALGAVLMDRSDRGAAEDVEEDIILDESSRALDTIEPSERPRLIVEAAQEVRDNQQDEWTGSEGNLIATRDVLTRLRGKGLDLGVRQPFAVIGTVLSSAENFKKVARNTFEYTPPTVDPDDIPF